MPAPPGIDEIAPGLWSWARSHPEWHPGDFGAEVVGFMVRAGAETLLIDPLLDGDDDPAWGLIASTGSGPIRILLTITYHVRSAEPVRDRLGGEREVTIHGHPAVAKRLASTADFEPFAAGDELPGGVTARERATRPSRHPRHHRQRRRPFPAPRRCSCV